jgi:hypothetical protein
MDEKVILELVQLRQKLISEYHGRKDWKSNKNAIMREMEHVELVHSVIKKIDEILSGHVEFS